MTTTPRPALRELVDKIDRAIRSEALDDLEAVETWIRAYADAARAEQRELVEALAKALEETWRLLNIIWASAEGTTFEQGITVRACAEWNKLFLPVRGQATQALDRAAAIRAQQ